MADTCVAEAVAEGRGPVGCCGELSSRPLGKCVGDGSCSLGLRGPGQQRWL